MSTTVQVTNGMRVETRGKRVFINGQEVVDCKCGKSLAPKSVSRSILGKVALVFVVIAAFVTIYAGMANIFTILSK